MKPLTALCLIWMLLASCALAALPAPTVAPHGEATGTGADASSAQDGDVGNSAVVAVPDMLGLQGAAFHVALMGEHFDRAGAPVTLLPVANPFAGQTALLDGKADVAILPVPAVARSVKEPRPLVALGVITAANPLNFVVAAIVAKERGLLDRRPFAERMAGLKGLTIGLPQGAIAGQTLADILDAASLAPGKDVTLLVLPREELVPALQSGRVQGLVAHHPDVNRAVGEAGAVVVLHTSAGDGPVPTAQPMAWYVLATTREYHASHGEALRRLLLGLQSAQQWVHDDPDAAARLLRPRFGDLSDAAFAEGVRLYFAAVPVTPLISEDAYRNALRSVRAEVADFDRAVDNSLLMLP